MKGSEFLKRRFNLHAAAEVDKAAKRTHKRTGEKVPQVPTERIQNYLDRFKEIAERKDEDKKRQGLRALKKVLHDAFVIKPEDIPESYFELQQQIAREQGHGTIEITPEMREEAVKVIQEDQRASLDAWINYLASNDALYPDWAKYWAFRSVGGMSLFDKEKAQFGKRSKHTTAPFPDLNREALAYVVDVIEKRIKGENIPNPVQARENINADEDREKLVTDEEFQHLLSTENFSKYYAFAIEHVVADNAELFKITDGEWRIFKKGSDPLELTKTLQGHGTGWCTAGESTAAYTLREGDFYVYYSKNSLGVPTIPRLAIRLVGDALTEVRGVAHEQEIDPYISPILETKLEEFGDEGEEYKQKAENMKRLTRLVQKTHASEPLSRDDLRFLYEIDGDIEGFGYGRDPRIEEIIEKRDPYTDARVIFGADDNKFLTGFLGLNANVICKFLGIHWNEENDGEFDYEATGYDEKLEQFLAPHMKEMKGLSIKAADVLLEMYYAHLVVEARRAFAFKDKPEIVQDLMKYDEDHGTEYFPDMLRDFFEGASSDEQIAFLEKQIDEENFNALEDIIPQVGEIPVRIAQKLVKAGRADILASGLKKFVGGLDSDIAKFLIDSGHAFEVSDNLKLFTRLDIDVYEQLRDEGYVNDIEKNPQAFDLPDERVKKNPFGQWVRNNPFK